MIFADYFFIKEKEMEFTIVLECDVKPDDDSNFIAEC